MPVRLVRHLQPLVRRGLIGDVDLVATVDELDDLVPLLVVSAHLGKGDRSNSQEREVPLVDAADSLGLGLG